MSLSEKAIDEFQEIYRKEHGVELSRAEASDAANRLVGLFDILFQSHVEDLRRKEKLKEFPKGFSYMDGKSYNCGICHNYIKDGELWYDKYGHKCFPCQGAIDKKIIPGRICFNDKLWYATHEFEMYFKLKSPTVRKLVRQGVLKARVVPDTGFHVFLIKDNIDTLPPKELVKGGFVKSGENMQTYNYWYELYDPKEVLKDYKILSYFKFE